MTLSAMDDSPRASKRRKLEPPNRTVSSPLKQPSARKSGRLANRSASYANGDAQKEPAEEVAANVKRRSGELSSGKTDVWDDIEGALAEKPKKEPKRRRWTKHPDPSKPHPFKTIRREDPESERETAEELPPLASTPKGRKAKATVDGESASRASFRSLVNGYKHGAGEAEVQDELAAEASTPTKRGRNAAPATGSAARQTRARGAPNGVEAPSQATPSRRSSARTRQRADSEDELAAATPSRSITRGTRLREQPTIPDSEDDLANHDPPCAIKSARRRAHRVDHLNNRHEEVEIEEELVHVSDDEQASHGTPMVNGCDMDVDGNSAMGSVLDPTEPSPFNKPASAQKETAALLLLNGHLEPSHELDLLKSIVLGRITGQRPAPLVGLDEEYKSVYQLVENTITAGEGNSMLLIGARGSGKTALVNKVLSEVSKDNSQDYHVVRLNGFIHTDDKIALREIWRQLGKEMDIDEEGGGIGKGYADTLTTLLALLSHPSEHTGEPTDQVAKAVIFIMDEFDHFAQHPRQTLLYNLFDIAQSRKAPIAVLGLTTRIDVANSLEKRVKSRFSHRYIHLSLAKTFTAFQEVCKVNLLLQPEELNIEERGILEAAVRTPSGKKSKKNTKTNILSAWNSNIKALFTSKDFLTTHLTPYFYRTKSIPSVLTTFLLPTCTLSPSLTLNPSPPITVTPPDSKLSLLPALSTLALSLLIATARLDIIHDSDTCNFNMAYDEYVTLASKARIQSAAGGASASGAVSKVWGKEVARHEWEGLVELGLVMPVVGGVTGVFGMVKADVALEEIGAMLAGERGVDKGLERWCRQI